MKLESKCFIKTFKNFLATNCKEIVTQYTVVLLSIVDIQIEHGIGKSLCTQYFTHFLVDLKLVKSVLSCFLNID